MRISRARKKRRRSRRNGIISREVMSKAKNFFRLCKKTLIRFGESAPRMPPAFRASRIKFDSFQMQKSSWLRPTSCRRDVRPGAR